MIDSSENVVNGSWFIWRKGRKYSCDACKHFFIIYVILVHWRHFSFVQVTNFWTKVLSEEEKTRLVENIAGHLKDATEFIQKRAVSCVHTL